MELTNCTHTNCQATFFHNPNRQTPTLCIEHAADADRDNGWTPENSQ